MNTVIKPLASSPDLKILLKEGGLNTSDIDDLSNLVFMGCYDDDSLVGVVGLELYRSVAALRSLAVAKKNQRSGLGTALVKAAEYYAAGKEIQHLFVMTTKAVGFFEKLGYRLYPRSEAPAMIAKSALYASMPISSAFLHKMTLEKRDNVTDMKENMN